VTSNIPDILIPVCHCASRNHLWFRALLDHRADFSIVQGRHESCLPSLMAISRILAQSLALLAAPLLFLACSGSSSPDDGAKEPEPGSECSTDGESKPAADGCNTCSCSDGRWACTEMACLPEECSEGATTNDGCNTCSCSGGQWACTERACEAEICTPGEIAPDPNSCNECTCGESGNEWECTDRDCPTTECTDGQTKDADDGCNTCSCSDGLWSCTQIGCVSVACGGRLGPTCSEDEYCHYATSDICGAADATGICRVKPEICDAAFSPVCGCDGRDYPNSCGANAAGTSAASEGECQEAQ
jgi:hypothetical protein